VKAGKIAYGLVDVLLGEKLTAFKYSLQTQFTIATLSGRVVETHKKLSDILKMYKSAQLIKEQRRQITEPTAGPLREILPGGTKNDTGSPSFWGPCRNLYGLLV